jgi:hypothetical protein
MLGKGSMMYAAIYAERWGKLEMNFDESFERAQRAYDNQSDDDEDLEGYEDWLEDQADIQLDDMYADQAERALEAIREAGT